MPDLAKMPVKAPLTAKSAGILQGEARTSGFGIWNRSPILPITCDARSSPGQLLDRDTHAFVEPGFNYDFAQVPLHSREVLSREVNANAEVVGEHVKHSH